MNEKHEQELAAPPHEDEADLSKLEAERQRELERDFPKEGEND